MPISIATRALVIGFKATGKTTREIEDLTKLPKRTINDIYARAIQRGFDPNERPLILPDDILADAPRSGRRPTKQSTESQDKTLAKVRFDRYGREKTCADIAGELSQEGIDISTITVWRILRKLGLRKTNQRGNLD
ncbi:hypothetical protein NUU61_001468 [Penicillium alfredii]|uniref:Transposase Tc1-like domain-containing protein n=1 Tax=Penicillium alfredii TaxID=1506179 RepID=A0A9W9KNC4_9EURO|nr:uncharacterized protein NUU61_001468 [Penicillium alfredii]KAJ5111838.1 hypothetical protein NUU61_001468 [Penicillium alfredii]